MFYNQGRSYAPPATYPARGLFSTAKPYAPAEKWQEIANYLGVSGDMEVSHGMVQRTNDLISGTLESLQDYLDTNHPEYRQYGNHSAYDLFFPVVSELAISMGLVGVDEEQQNKPPVPKMAASVASLIKNYQEEAAELEKQNEDMRLKLEGLGAD